MRRSSADSLQLVVGDREARGCRGCAEPLGGDLDAAAEAFVAAAREGDRKGSQQTLILKLIVIATSARRFYSIRSIGTGVTTDSGKRALRVRNSGHR